MTIGELLLFDVFILALVSYAQSFVTWKRGDQRRNILWNTIFFLCSGLLILHDAYGNRLLPEPNEGAICVMASLGLLYLLVACVQAWLLWKSK